MATVDVEQRIALVDCVACFVSCERVFRPELRDRPVVVASPNDSFVISCSEEAKVLGIAVGDSIYELRPRVERGEVVVCSANYELYAERSARVMETLRRFSPRIEVYSIDEAFLDLTGVTDITRYGQRIRQAVSRYTGIPVRVGIAPTKTLAKLANRLAQQWPTPESASGVLDLSDPCRRRDVLERSPVDMVWGIGSGLQKRLHRHHITTAAQLVDAPDWWIRKCLGVDGLRTALELRGIACFHLDLAPTIRKTCGLSGAFGRPVVQLSDICEAVSCYITTACTRLKRERLVASTLSVTLWTVRDPKTRRQHSITRTASALIATNHTQVLASLARKVLGEMYLRGYSYSRVGIVLHGLMSDRELLQTLFDTPNPKIEQLAQVMADINACYGKRAIYLAAEGKTQSWQARRAYLSPAYTTNIHDIPIVES